ncbi:lymphocyte-specific helicase [Procambarus clarkii]|uniref:lymphocyte-specific helicase n=1 Tax=Procambarus clarkii TaxID=6728 RepID=UPI001E67619D|nr:lymphocyte-specific helicase-like [Procambarus clarkii]XP_045596635.1 lymphocyte-specific helicase-like [Procambarus clarkii]XP_045596636.1 lymphocyte-specific helicase-like [Procambarus clarkii]
MQAENCNLPSDPAAPDFSEEAENAVSRVYSPKREGSQKTCVFDEDMVTTEMLAEEEKLEAANVKEEERIRLQLEERKREEKQLQEQRYKRLMHLLNKSEFYSKFLLQQIKSQEAIKKSKKNSKCKGHPDIRITDKENLESEGNSSQESSKGSNRKRKLNGESIGKQGKRLRNSKYNIGDVIDTDTVKAKMESGSFTEEEESIGREDQPRLFENGTMRPYQLDGFSWLTVLFENGVNGILGDEMGLGKTIQCIALICHLVEQGVPGPFLICGPLSTLPNWMLEFERFAPKIPTLLYHGQDIVRIQKRRKIQARVPVEGAPVPVFPVVITSYEVAIRDTRYLNKFQWRYICVDEGHRLKNHKCRLTKSLNTFPTTNRLLLTGTPLQNNLAELWALLNFLMPEIFDSLDVFESWFDVTDMMEKGSNEKIIQQEKEKHVISTLMKILSPFLLRRVKKDVDIDIPPKKELLVYTPMTPLQVKLYEATLTSNNELFNNLKNSEQETSEYTEKGRPKRKSRAITDLSVFMKNKKDDSSSDTSLDKFIEAVRKFHEKPAQKEVEKTSLVRIKMQNKMMQCRKIVNHPYLIDYPLNKDGTFMVDNGLLEVCGKLQVLDQLLAELYKRKHRVLIFSQMTMMMDILEDYLTLRPQYKYKRLDGASALEDRQSDIKEFNDKNSSDFLFLLSTRAGGLGINLATADTVIIYDSDWNPQCDLQAQDRCHRIGQTSPVLVLRLVTASTIDERVVDRAATKRKLEKLIIQSGKFKSAKQSDRVFEKVMDEEELITLLKERDHERIHRTTTGNVFTKEELNRLLDRSDLIKKKRSGKETNEQALNGVFRVVNEDDS